MMGSMILAISVQASVVILLGPVNINTDAEEILIGSLASVAIVPVFWIYMSKKLQDILWKCLGFWILHFSKVFSRIFCIYTFIFTTHKSSENWKGERKIVSINRIANISNTYKMKGEYYFMEILVFYVLKTNWGSC